LNLPLDLNSDQAFVTFRNDVERRISLSFCFVESDDFDAFSGCALTWLKGNNTYAAINALTQE